MTSIKLEILDVTVAYSAVYVVCTYYWVILIFYIFYINLMLGCYEMILVIYTKNFTKACLQDIFNRFYKNWV